MLVALGYIYPLLHHKRLAIKPDAAALYRFQVNRTVHHILFSAPLRHIVLCPWILKNLKVFGFVLSRHHTSGPHSSGLLRIQIMVRSKSHLTLQSQITVLNAQLTLPFCFTTESNLPGEKKHTEERTASPLRAGEDEAMRHPGKTNFVCSQRLVMHHFVSSGGL